jgi:hypothetical protein
MEWMLIVVIYFSGDVFIEQLRFAQRDECLEAEAYISKTVNHVDTRCMMVEKL